MQLALFAVRRLAAALVVLFAVVLGRAQQVQYAKQHYTKTTLFLQEGGPQKAYEFAQKQQHKRIGIVGSSEIIFGQYGFFGNPPTNEVEYIGVPGPHGAYRLATSCSQFMERINAGNYDYVIMSRETVDSKESEQGEYWYPIYDWVRRDPALELKINEATIVPQPDYVFKVKGELSPQYCPSQAEEEKFEEEVEVEEEAAELEAREEEQAAEEASEGEETVE